MILDHSREKLLNLIIYFIKHTKYCYKTKLFKLLYLADFECFKQSGRSITGLKYYAWPKGPVPVQLFNELEKPPEDLKKMFSITKFEDSETLNIKPKYGIKFDDKHFNKLELEIIKKMAYIYKEIQSNDITEITHLKNCPWDKTKHEKGMQKLIDYLLAFDDSKESLTIEKYRQYEHERNEITSILSLCNKEK